ncbi:MAG: T9SS type A sorting domain-containing protein [Paludibacter sp.]|nr:T9SS type A sorting domain-containing protein [Paludibacter sp.]
MKKLTFILFLSLIVVFVHKTMAQTDTVLVKTIKINLTKADGASGGDDWNDIADFSAGLSHTLKDSTGAPINYTFYNEDSWDGQSSTGGVPGGPYPDPVCLSYWALKEKKTADIEFRNLNNNSIYYLEFYGARDQTDVRVTKVVIKDSVSRFQAVGNTSEKAIFRNVHPTAGVIRASIEMDRDLSLADWAYLGAIVIREYSVSTGVNDLFMSEYSNLLSNFPNPFKQETSIKYKVPVAGSVSLNVYDARGKEVKTLIKGNQEPGEYCQNWDASGLSSGLYFLRMMVQPEGAVIPVVSVRKLVITE